MSKIIVRKQEYANNGTHADEIKAVVRDDLVVNTLSSATDLVPSVGLVKSETDAIKDALSQYVISSTFNSASPITINTGAVASVTIPYTVPSGYEFLFECAPLMSNGDNTGNVNIYNWWKDVGANSISLRAKNIGTANATNVTFTIRIGFKKVT